MATNSAPTAVRLAAAISSSSAAAAIAENAAGAIIGTLTTIDPNAGDSFTYTVSDSRFEVVGATLKLKAGVALNYEVARALNITVTARDQGGLTKAQSFGLAVTNVNEGPTAVKLAGATVAENAAGAAIGTLSTIDPDAGNSFTYTVSDNRFEVVGNTLKLKAGISLDFEAASRVALTVTSTDQGGLSKAQAFSIAVGNANDLASIGGAITGSVSEDGTPTTAGTLTVADQDAGQAGFRMPASLAGTYGSFSFDAATGAWGYSLVNTLAAVQALVAGQAVHDTLTVTSLDGSASQAVTVTVHGVNDAPVVTSAATASFAENATGTVYTATGTDVDAGTTLTWSLGGADAALFDINAATGAVSFKAAPDYEAPADAGTDNTYDVTVTASDGSLSSTARAVAISVTAVNEAPVVTSGGTASFAENATGPVYTATGTDVDAGTTLTWSLGGTDAALFDINAATGAVSFKAAPDFEAPADAGANNVYDLTVTASDGSLSSTARAVAISVTAVNEAPVVTSGATASFAENATGPVYTATGTDVDAGTTLTWSLGGADAALFDINSATGAVSFKAAPDYEAPGDTGADNTYDVTVTASDGSLSSAARAVAISVTAVNEAPVVTSGATASFAENATGTVYTATGTDVDAGTTLTWSLGGADAALFDINSATGAVSFKAAPDYEAPGDTGADNTYDVTVTASDGSLSSTARSVAITVTNVDEVATISGTATGSVTEDGTLTTSGTLTIADQDSGQAAFAVPASLAGTYGSFSFNATTGAWGYALDNGQANVQALKAGQTVTDTLTVASLDGTASQAITVSIAGTNDAAGITGSVAGAVTEDGTLAASGTLGVTDVDTGETAFQVPSSLAGTYGAFTFNATTGAWGYALANGQANVQALKAGQIVTDTLTVSSLDGTASQAITVSITGTNDAPSVTSGGAASFAENGTGTAYTVIGTDTDAGTTLSYSLSGTDAALFNMNTSTGAVTFKTAPNFEAPVDAGTNNVYDINVVASDGALTATKAVAITVTNVNEAPVVTSTATVSFAENATGTVYTATATDQDAGTTLSYSLSGTDAARFDIDAATGAVSFKAAPDFEAPADAGTDNVYDINVVASDGPLTASKAVAITVTNVNEVPVVTSGDTASFAENDTGTVYTATATDPDAGTTLAWSLGGTDATLFNVNAGTGAVSFKAAPDFEAPADAGADNTYDLTVNAFDGTLTTSQAVAITVTSVNEAPPTVRAGGVPNFLVGGSSTGGTIDAATFTDPDAGDTLTWSLTQADGSALPSWMSFNATTHTISQNNKPIPGAVALTVTVTDSGGLSASTSFTFNGPSTGGDNLDYSGSTAAVAVNANVANDTVFGSAYADTINGWLGADSINAGAGDDILIGLNANDVLTGGSGSDTFVYDTASTGEDRIVDFASGTDKLQFTTSTTGLSAGTLPTASLVGGKLVLAWTTTAICTITFDNITSLTGIVAGDYVFV